MKKITLYWTSIALLAIIATSCFDENDESIQGSELELTALSKNLTDIDELLVLMDSSVFSATSGVTTQIPQSRKDLEKMRTVVKLYNGEDNAGITVPGFGGVKLSKEETNLNVYYIETKVVNSSSDSIVYGCGYSVHYLFKKVKRGISIDNLPSVAASAQLSSNRTQVFYSLQTYGIIGNNLIRYFKPTVNKNFNVDGFGIMQSSIDGIHNILGDTTLSKTVKFTPEILKFVRPYELEQL